MTRLTERERLFLAYLGDAQGAVVSRQQLLTDVWNWSPNAVTRAVDDLVKRLRPKLEADPSTPTYLLTAHGIGYRLVLEPPKPPPTPAPVPVVVAAMPAPEAPVPRSAGVALGRPGGRAAPLVLGRARLDLERAELEGPDGVTTLTSGELALLEALLRARGAPVERRVLLRSLSRSATAQALTNAVRRIRAKIEEDPEQPRFLQTVRGVGYQLLCPLPAEPRLREATTSGLVGREALLAELHAALAPPSRVLRVTGPAGSGKTRLARELAADVDRCWLVDLKGITDAAGLAQAVLLVAGQQGCPGRLPDALEGAPLRLILDNTEELVDTAPLEAWLAAVPTLSLVLVGRRVPLLEEGESIEVGPLSPADARALFVDRARRSSPGWRGAPADQEALDALLLALDYLPLGIELAAAWMRLLSVSQLKERLLTDLSLLRRPGMAQGLHEVVGASWALLSPAGQQGLLLACALPSAFELDLLERVLQPDGLWALEVLQELLDLHLIHPVPANGTDTPRFLPYDLVRVFARSRLTAAHRAQVLDAMADHIAAQVEPLASEAPERLIDSLALLDTTLAELPDTDPRLWPVALVRLTLARRFGLGQHQATLTARLHAAPPPDPALGSRVWHAAVLAYMGRDPQQAEACAAALERCGAASGAPEAQILVYSIRALMFRAQSRAVESLEAFKQGIAVAVASGQELTAARLQAGCAPLLRHLGRTEEALAMYQDTLERFAALTEPDNEAICRLNHAVLLRSLGRYHAAREELERCAEHAMSRGLADLESCARQNLGLLLHEQGALTAARQHLELAVRLAADLGHHHLAAIARTCLGMLLETEGEPAAARRLLLEALAGHRRVHNARFVALTEAALALVDPVDGEARAAEAVRHLRALSFPEDLGACLVLRARVREASGAIEAALGDLHEAIELLQGRGSPFQLAWAQASLARLQPRHPAAAESLAAAHQLSLQLEILPHSALAQLLADAAPTA